MIERAVALLVNLSIAAPSPTPTAVPAAAHRSGVAFVLGILLLGLVLLFIRRRFQRAAEMFERESELEIKRPDGRATGPPRRPWEEGPPNGSGAESNDTPPSPPDGET